MEWGGWKQFHFEGMLLLKTCPKLGLQKPVLGLQAFKSGEAACKSCALPTQETTTHTYHRTLKDTGQGGPPWDSLGQKVVNRGMLLSGNQGAHPAARVGSLCHDYCSERFQSEPLDTSNCCDIVHPFLNGSCS